MLKGIIGQLSKKAIMTAITVPEGIVMLFIAVLLDGAGIILFVLSLIGIGIPITFLLSILGAVTIGTWALLRPLSKGLMSKATEQLTSKMFNAGGGLEGAGKSQETPAPETGAGKKVGRAGAKLSLSATRFLISFGIELTPFLGNIFPAWTFLVIFELVQGEI